MARSDLLVGLVRAGLHKDPAQFRRIVEGMIAEERAKQHNVLADRLTDILSSNGNGSSRLLNGPDEQAQNLVYETVPRRKLSELILPDVVQAACSQLVEEHHRADLLRSYSLEPRHRVLLVGPPGNGKTSLAEALSEALIVPLYVVRYDSLIGSYLGETAQRLRRLFDFVRTRQCVLFFDEFDTLGKERGDTHETGEIKRVVSSLLLQIDMLPSYVVVVTATNHPELLDRAVWRRFQLRLSLPAPSCSQLEKWFQRFADTVDVPLGFSPKKLAQEFDGLSFAEAEEFCADVLRGYVLSKPHGNGKDIVRSLLKQWRMRYQLPNGDTEPVRDAR